MAHYMINEVIQSAIETKESYGRRRLAHWAQLAEFAAEKMQQQEPRLVFYINSAVFYGARVAIEEERVTNCQLWWRPGVYALAIQYGRVFRSAQRYDLSAFLAALKKTPASCVPSPQAIFRTAQELKLDLKVSEAELCAHVVQKLPSWAKNCHRTAETPTPQA